MWMNLMWVWAVLVGVWAAEAYVAAVLPDDESKVVSGGLESLCELVPDLPACLALNDTLLLLHGKEERVDVAGELLDPDPLLPQIVRHLTFLQHHNADLMERDNRHATELASLYREKTHLLERLTELEGQGPRSRYTRTTQTILSPPIEASSADALTSHRPVTGQPHLYANTLRPVDCADYLIMGYSTSGVYNIYPFTCRCSKPLKVWCDMETDGGGWTVFLSRQNLTTKVDFNRTWNEYREGFGNVSGEYWLGNEALHTLTTNRRYTLRMDFRLTPGDLKWGEWTSIKVANENNKYKLEVPAYNGLSMIDHCFSASNNRFFSTYDYDNDNNAAKHCAADIKGGWWYNNCGNLDPTLPFTASGQLNTTCPYKSYNKKIPLHGNWLQMKIRPAACNKNVKAVYFNGYTCNGHND